MNARPFFKRVRRLGNGSPSRDPLRGNARLFGDRSRERGKLRLSSLRGNRHALALESPDRLGQGSGGSLLTAGDRKDLGQVEQGVPLRLGGICRLAHLN